MQITTVAGRHAAQSTGSPTYKQWGYWAEAVTQAIQLTDNPTSTLAQYQPSRDGGDSQPRLRLASEVSVRHALVATRNQRFRLATGDSDKAAVVTTRNQIDTR
ncbi:hypothetical protein HanIR_Chr01g0005101 [Helianthus annuus]|nr:hypothetical protein HanIR_Chr01g0005101 [Helianthus annuus]